MALNGVSSAPEPAVAPRRLQGHGYVARDVTGLIRAGNSVTIDGTGTQASPYVINAIGDGTGDVQGPATATDNAIARFDGTTGKLVQNSGVTIDDTNNVATAGTLTSGAVTPTIGQLNASGGASFTTFPTNTASLGTINSTTGWVGTGFAFSSGANNAFSMVYNGGEAYFGKITNIAQTVWYMVAATGLSVGTSNRSNRLDINGSASIGSYSATAAPSNSLIVSGNVGIGSSNPTTALVLGDTGGTAAGGITFGTDTNLYRSAADTLKTDDALIVGSTANPGLTVGTTGGGYFKLGDATLRKAPGNFFSFQSDGVQGINNLVLGVDSPNVNRRFYITGNFTVASWATAGPLTQINNITITDSSAAGTRASAVAWSHAQPTFAASNAATAITDAATMYIANAPAAGTNMTLTNPYALWVDAGNVRLDGSLSVGTAASPTALLHLAAGTATANTAPMKLTSGVALTTPEDGALEYHSSHLYFTIGATRYQLDQQSGATYTDEMAQDAVGTILTDSATIDFTYNDAGNSITAAVIDNSIGDVKIDTTADLLKRVIRIVIDGGGSAITTGAKKAYVSVPFDCTITKARLLADQSGSIVVDVWKDSYANFAPTVADTITASAKPTLSSAQKSEDSTLTGWTTTLSAGDVLEVNVDSASTVTKVFLDLFVRVT